MVRKREPSESELKKKKKTAAEGTYVDTAVLSSLEWSEIEESQLILDIRRKAARQSRLEIRQGIRDEGLCCGLVKALLGNAPSVYGHH
jgi:hypothetical protein